MLIAMEVIDDHELVRRWQAGDTAAGHQVLTSHFWPIYRFLRGKLEHRADDLAQNTRLCARRRGTIVGFVAGAAATLGPALALDASDLGVLLGRALENRRMLARLSTAAPAALPVLLALGFRVASLGLILSRGPAAPARPPQLYSLVPEVL